MRFLTRSVLSLFVLSLSFLARLSVCTRQKMRLGLQKIAAAKKIPSIIETGVWPKSFNCYGLFAFTVNMHKHSAKLKSTTCPSWLLAYGWESSLKTLSNSYFLPIPLNIKTGGGLSKKRGIKVKGAFLENAL